MKRISAGSLLGPVVATLLMVAAPVLANDSYPQKPVKMVVPYAPGGTTDLAGRIVAEGLSKSLGGSFVVENIPGAAGSLGVGQAVRAAPDGYSLAVSGVSATLIHDLLGRDLNYDPKTDLNAIGFLGASGMMIVTGPASRFENLAQVIAQSKEKPGSVSFGSAGVASPGHMATEYLANMADIEMVHLPYTGDSALMTDLMSGRIDFATVGIASVFSHLESGSVKALAITSAQRVSTFPDVPTVAEAGDLPGYEADIWNLLVTPKDTSPEISQKLNDAVNGLMAGDEVPEKLLKVGFVAQEMSLDDIQQFIEAERAKWGTVIEGSGPNLQ